MRQALKEVAVEPGLVEGARNAVNVCLRIQAREKVTLITDEASVEIAAALAGELDQVGAQYRPFVLEDVAARPLADMPRPVLEDLRATPRCPGD